MAASRLDIHTDLATAGAAATFGYAHGIANMASGTTVNELALAARCLR